MCVWGAERTAVSVTAGDSRRTWSRWFAMRTPGGCPQPRLGCAAASRSAPAIELRGRRPSPGGRSRMPRTPAADQQPTRIERRAAPALEARMALTGIWYIIGFAFAAGSFAFLTFGVAWLVSHRNRGDVHKGLPYESGIDTYGDTHGRFGLSFYIYALLFVAFDIE